MKIIAPTFVMLPRKTKADKKFALNLNIYRNTHHAILNQAKKIFNELMREQLEGVKLKTPIIMIFQYVKGTKRRSDKQNVLSIVEKFLCDSLVNYGCIPDDNDDFILSQVYKPTIYEKNKARVIIEIIEEE